MQERCYDDENVNNEFTINEISKKVCHVDKKESWTEEIKVGNVWLEFKLDSGSDIIYYLMMILLS